MLPSSSMSWHHNSPVGAKACAITSWFVCRLPILSKLVPGPLRKLQFVWTYFTVSPVSSGMMSKNSSFSTALISSILATLLCWDCSCSVVGSVDGAVGDSSCGSWGSMDVCSTGAVGSAVVDSSVISGVGSIKIVSLVSNSSLVLICDIADSS